MNYKNVTKMLTHVQTVDTSCSSLILRVPGNESIQHIVHIPFCIHGATWVAEHY